VFDVEFKARYDDLEFIRTVLKEKGAKYQKKEEQTDIYFDIPNGRLKLRKGNKEELLIYYSRENIKGIKPSEFQIYRQDNLSELESILRKALVILVEVRKTREVYRINNLKFNLDVVHRLGKFIEIEAFTENSSEIPELKLLLEKYKKLFAIPPEALQSHSYCDLLINQKKESDASWC
jgi:predicted adenylyl cyclase CyaB